MVNADIHAGDLPAVLLKILPQNAAIAVTLESCGKNKAMAMDASNCYIFFRNCFEQKLPK